MKNIKNAFSLVEVLIIFTVMSVILAASLPTFTKKGAGIPFSIQQGSYYCVSFTDENGDTKLREVLYAKKEVIKDGIVDKCVFNPPNKATIFRITLIGAGNGGYDTINVTNPKMPEEMKKVKFTMHNGYEGDVEHMFMPLQGEALWKLFAGKDIIYVNRIAHGGKGGDIRADVYREPYGSRIAVCKINNSLYRDVDRQRSGETLDALEARTKKTCDIWGGTLVPYVTVTETFKGGDGGNGGFLNLKFKLPKNTPNIAYTDIPDLLKKITTMFQGGSCEQSGCQYISEENKTFDGVNGQSYGMSPNGPITGNLDAPPGKEATGWSVIKYPTSDFSGYLYTSNLKHATGGTGASVKNGSGSNGTKGKDAGTTNLKQNGEGYWTPNDSGAQWPGLDIKTDMTYRHYEIGTSGANAQLVRDTKYSLEGPCNIEISGGGKAYFELPAASTAEQLATRIVCRDYENVAMGGQPSVAIETHDDYITGGDIEKDKKVGGEIGDPLQKNEPFFRYADSLKEIIETAGRGGKGPTFIDKCNSKSEDNMADNRYSGTFVVKSINSVNGATIKTEISKTLSSTCITDKNKYGTARNKYEYIGPGDGYGGAVIIAW